MSNLIIKIRNNPLIIAATIIKKKKTLRNEFKKMAQNM